MNAPTNVRMSERELEILRRFHELWERRGMSAATAFECWLEAQKVADERDDSRTLSHGH